MLIAILNRSTLVADTDVSAMTEAVHEQVHMDAAPHWERAPAAVVFYKDPNLVPADAHGITIVDTIQDQPKGVLGFHTEGPGGKIWGVVAAKSALDHGGQATTGDWSVSSLLSHEVLEMFIDPNCNLWADDGKGSTYSLEVCDPVEAPTYTIRGISVCNFVTPAWFDPRARATAQFDKLGELSAAFSIARGGYVVYESAGEVHQQFGHDFPDWRKKMKSGQLARGGRRVTQASQRTALYSQRTALYSQRT
jgi:hypothetical protein